MWKRAAVKGRRAEGEPACQTHLSRGSERLTKEERRIGEDWERRRWRRIRRNGGKESEVGREGGSIRGKKVDRNHRY